MTFNFLTIPIIDCYFFLKYSYLIINPDFTRLSTTKSWKGESFSTFVSMTANHNFYGLNSKSLWKSQTKREKKKKHFLMAIGGDFHWHAHLYVDSQIIYVLWLRCFCYCKLFPARLYDWWNRISNIEDGKVPGRAWAGERWPCRSTLLVVATLAKLKAMFVPGPKIIEGKKWRWLLVTQAVLAPPGSSEHQQGHTDPKFLKRH